MLGNRPLHHQMGMVMPAVAASRPLDVPVTALELNRFCHTTARVHWGMI